MDSTNNEVRNFTGRLAEKPARAVPFARGAADTARSASTARREIALTVAALIFTCIACVFLGIGFVAIVRELAGRGDIAGVLGQVVFIVIIGLLTWGNLVYQLTRTAHYRRWLDHNPAPRAVLEKFFAGTAPKLTVLVPAYREEAQLVRRTLLSAALQDYPNRRVVLLIDDPAVPTSAADARALRVMQSLIPQLRSLFGGIAAKLGRECAAYESRRAGGAVDLRAEADRVSGLYEAAAGWVEAEAARVAGNTPGDVLLRDQVLLALAREHRSRAHLIMARARSDELGEAQLLHEYRRLACLFRVEFASFERKRYVNLAHEPNKAMNLNAYIGLMGGHFREVQRSDGLHLAPCAENIATRSVPDADYLITLDADSMLVPDYALRLVHYMNAPGNERVAVAQTPYSTIPAPPGTLEYVAGATTDIQYNIHQGFTAFGGTYWVGANALLRKSALTDIAEPASERGFPVTRFIQDRTIIEDTESSIDLVARGWQLYNYPARLAYSATPPDFGALLIQRRRWANGGLIILPKLLRYLLRGPSPMRKAVEGFFRCHYLVSIAAVNTGLIIMLAFSFEQNLRSPWLPLSAVPYFVLYARDLAIAGYRHSDVLRVYALNMMLIAVNLGGVLKSLQQAIMSRKSVFGRTPKVAGRTSAPAAYVLAEYLLLAWWLETAISDFVVSQYAHMAFALTSAGFLAYAIFRYIGWKNSVADMHNWFVLRNGSLMTRVPVQRRAVAAIEAERRTADAIMPAGMQILASKLHAHRNQSRGL